MLEQEHAMRYWLLLLLGLSTIGCQSRAQTELTEFRIGCQKWGILSLMKAKGVLEPRLAARGIKVVWTEFPSGPPILDAMNSGGIHFGHTGDSPPLFAQAAGLPIVYVAASTPSPTSSAILVRRDSPIQSVQDLKGRKVGFTKGTSGHAMVLRAMSHARLSISDVESVYLPSSDARTALEGGSIDAWSVWDPYLATAEFQGGARILLDGTGLVAGREFYLAEAETVKQHPDVLQLVLEELGKLQIWARERPEMIAQLQSESLGLPLGAMQLAEGRRGRYGFDYDVAAWTAEQQRLADEFVELGLLPRSFAVRDAVHPLITE